MLLLLQLTGGAILVAERTFFPLFAIERGMSASWIAGVSGGRQLMGMAAALVGGYLADLVGRKWTYFIGSVGFLAGALLFVTTTKSTFSSLWIASGFFLAIRTLGGQSYLVDAVGSGSLATTSALFTWGTTIGGAVGTFLLGLLLNASGYSVFGATIIAGSVFVLALIAMGMPRVGGAQKASTVVKLRYSALLRMRPILFMTLLRFFPTFYWGLAIVLVPLLLSDLGASTLYVAFYGTVSQIAASAAQMITGRVTDRRGPLVPTCVVLSILTIGIAGSAAFAGNIVIFFIMSVVAASAAWSMSALVPVLVARSVIPELRAKSLGWIQLWWNIGMVTGAWAGGWLFEINVALAFAAAAVVVATTPFVAYRLIAGANFTKDPQTPQDSTDQ